MRTKTLTQAELSHRLGVSRTHITLLTQGKRKLSDKLADKIADLLVDQPNAQQWTFNPLVTGSNPVRPTNHNFSTPKNKSYLRICSDDF